MVDLREDVVGIVATCAVDNGETAAVRELLRPEAGVLSLYDRFVSAEALIRQAREGAPPVPVNDDFIARLGLAPASPARRRPAPSLWLVAAGILAFAVGAAALYLPTGHQERYAPAGAGTSAVTLPDTLTLPDGEILAARPEAALPQLPCRVFSSGETAAITCLANDGTRQTILLEP